MNNQKNYLIHLLKEKENHNKYLFVNNYVPFIMTREGFDYVDSYMTSPASDNFFMFEHDAITNKKRYASMENKETLLRCLFINNRGKIEEVIKRKLKVSNVGFDSTNINFENLKQGISRISYENVFIESDLLVSEIISTKEFNYFFIERNEDDVTVYRVEILNNSSIDLVCNKQAKDNHKEVTFCRASFVYDKYGNFVDLEIIE